jgi:hypothetical protein
MDVTMDDVHDYEVLPRLLKDASINRDVAEAFMDWAYDTENSYIILRRMGIRPVIMLGLIGVLQRGECQQLYSRRLVREGGVWLWAMVEDGL